MREGEKKRACARKRERSPAARGDNLNLNSSLQKTSLPIEVKPFCCNGETPTPFELSVIQKEIFRWPQRYRSKPVICRARTTAGDRFFCSLQNGVAISYLGKHSQRRTGWSCRNHIFLSNGRCGTLQHLQVRICPLQRLAFAQSARPCLIFNSPNPPNKGDLASSKAMFTCGLLQVTPVGDGKVG